jgi:hypothetical protein
MTNDFSTDFATDIAEYLFDGTQLPTPPGTIYVALFDDTGTEVTSDFQNGRVGLAVPGDWSRSGSQADNGVDVAFGEATADVSNIARVGLWDSASGGTEFGRFDIDDADAPFDVSDGSTLTINTGNLDFDVLD